jgi:8-oxo-dGTP pyrophosphatase MutT (NUDIX family)
VRALLVRDQEMLLIHHRFQNPAMFDTWTFPGGRLDPGETDPLAALHREIQEELSIEIEILGELVLARITPFLPPVPSATSARSNRMRFTMWSG